MPRATSLTRVVVVEDHLLFAESLEVALTLEGHTVERIEVVDGLSSAALLSAVLHARPRMALVDLDLGHQQSGLRLVAPLTRASVAVIVVTSNTDPARWGECLLYGARTVLPKTGSLNSILAAIRHVGDGRSAITRDQRERLLSEFHHEQRSRQHVREQLESLTRREQVVLSYLMGGHQVREIARGCFLSEATVRTQVKAILAKLEVSSQLGAVGAANAVQWRPPPAPPLHRIPQLDDAPGARIS